MTTTYYYKQAAPRALKVYTDRRLDRELARVRLREGKARVTFDHEAESHCVKCELDDGHGIHVVASGIDPNVFAAVDEAVDRAVRQWMRESTRKASQRERGGHRSWQLAPTSLAADAEAGPFAEDDDWDGQSDMDPDNWNADATRMRFVP